MPIGGNPQDQQDQLRGKLKLLAGVVVGGVMFIVMFFCIVLTTVFGVSSDKAAAEPPSEEYQYPAESGIPEVYWPIYVNAATAFRVNPYLLASIHQQETGFSTNPAAKEGLNSYGAGGPMQFLTSTWRGHATAFLKIADKRPSNYPLMRNKLPSCVLVPIYTGCMYDDFDAIAGAAHKLKEDGATTNLYTADTHAAVCAYIGSCKAVNVATCKNDPANQYCDVIPRARKWEKSAEPEIPSFGSLVVVPGSTAKLLKNGLAAAPAEAPDAVKRMIAAGNEIAGRPYKLAHYDTHIDNLTYDCSSATSHLLWAGGKFGKVAWCSTDLGHYGRPAREGDWVTVYSHGPCGPEGHAYLVIAGLRYDTSPTGDTSHNAALTGPRWRSPRAYDPAFVARSPEGL